MDDAIEIDGSYKSGSGTILRDALSLSLLLKRPIHVKNIRARREKPGLRPQHLEAIYACKELSCGEAEGLFVGSKEIFFSPKEIKSGTFVFDIKTAGSATMLAMTIIPAGLFARGPSSYLIKGGLFQDFAPSAFHLKHVFLPLLERMGAQVKIRIIRPGYVPKGGGEIEIKIEPLRKKLKPLILNEQGKIEKVEGIALSSFLEKRMVSKRMKESCERILRSKGFNVTIEEAYDTKEKPAFEKSALQEGAILAIWASSDKGALLGSDMAGEKRRSAEFIGKEVALRLIEDIEKGATVDRFTADQLIPLCALAEGESLFYFPFLTDHMESRIWLMEEILKAKIRIEEQKIRIMGVGFER